MSAFDVECQPVAASIKEIVRDGGPTVFRSLTEDETGFDPRDEFTIEVYAPIASGNRGRVLSRSSKGLQLAYRTTSNREDLRYTMECDLTSV